MLKYEEDYLGLIDQLLTRGEWVENERTGMKCLTKIGHTLYYEPDQPPLLQSRQVYPVSAFAELLGYLRAYDNAQDFADIGCINWFENSNKTPSWLANPNRKGTNHAGDIYGVVARNFGGIDLLLKVYNNLRQGVDDRGEIITFWKPDEFDKACLRPCMYSHHFSLLNGNLYLTSTQRSVDVLRGLPSNSIQCYLFLKLMAKITGHTPAYVKHDMVNIHLYDNQIDDAKELLRRAEQGMLPKSEPTLEIQDWVTDLDDMIGESYHGRDYIKLDNYEHCGKMVFSEMAV